MPTVRDVTFNLLRQLDLTTFIGNPGSTEEPFLKNFPHDFTYLMALQEASVIGIADGLSQGLKKPVIVNVHTAVGLGNAMGCIVSAYQNKTPLIITAGQQTREMLLIEPFLTNVEATELPKPWVKWSYEPSRAQDIPHALMRAYITATQPPAGPVFLSFPLDDWEQEMPTCEVLRSTSVATAPDPYALASFVQKINESIKPVLVYGGDLARCNAWEEGIVFAEQLNAPVWCAPFIERNVFPAHHSLYQGVLPPAIRPLAEALKSHDLVVVIGAPIFRYYPWIPGPYLHEHSSMLHITDSPYEAAKAAFGTSLIANARLALVELIKGVSHRPPPHKKNVTSINNFGLNKKNQDTLTAQEVFAILQAEVPEHYVLVNESPSNVAECAASKLGFLNEADSFYAACSGGLGWAMPAAVGLAFAEQKNKRQRPVILIIGDGSFQYSPQAIWTGVQHKLHIIIVVLKNEAYGILKSFAQFENTANVPGLDLPGLDATAIANGYGAKAYQTRTGAELQLQFHHALKTKEVTLLEVPINKDIKPLLR